jgi:hypothetical protein
MHSRIRALGRRGLNAAVIVLAFAALVFLMLLVLPRP